jgi:hypothetical protein
MAFCANCGRAFTEGTQFCTACGSPVGAAPSQAAPPQASADQAATQVVPPGADQAATQVLLPAPAAAPDATLIMPPGMVPPPGLPATGPPAAAQNPPRYPPAGPPPVGYGMSGPPSGGSKKKLWIGLASAGAAIALIVILIVVLNPFGCGGGQFEGNWWALDDSGGLIIDGSQQVWIVEDDGTKYGPLDGTVKGDTLEFKLSDEVIQGLPSDLQEQASALAMVSFEAKFDKKSGHLFVTTKLNGDVGGLDSGFEPQTTEFKKVDVLPTQAPSETPSATPTISESPSPSPTPTPTDSGSPSASPTPTVDPAKDAQVRSGADTIVVGIAASFADLGVYPAGGSVVPGGSLEDYLPATTWPVNPYTAAPMTSGAGFGNYTYTLNADGSDYQLLANLGDGTAYVAH